MPNLTKKTNRSKKSKILRNKKKIGGGLCPSRPVESEDQVQTLINMVDGMIKMSEYLIKTIENDTFNPDIDKLSIDNTVLEKEFNTIVDNNGQNNNGQNMSENCDLGMSHEEYIKLLKAFDELESEIQTDVS
jgi:hypothetical protein